MTELSYKTKSGGSPEKKPRVYFTCHPADKERSLDKLCNDIFASSDCAVFYTEDMADRLSEETRGTDLERMNLFVIPVSLKLLIEPNRAMDEDFPFACEKHIPVLPILLEPGLDLVYSREDKFGTLQYLDPNAVDSTAIPYAEKLKKYLSATLFDSETVERIQAAFDAYIFLSYRKKDRKQANQLMRLIHADPKCRDIAIWFDEFLTPGESFTETIREAMERSKAFTLLVTPSLLELNDRGEPNYVQATEYPEAKALAEKRKERQETMEFLPAELPAEEASLTDRTALFRGFAELPDPMNLNSEEERECFLARLRKLAAEERKDDPTHHYLIGLAYLDGIDVEIDRERGLELITAAGEAELPEAMEKLYQIYSDVEVNVRQATRWAEKIVEYFNNGFEEDDPRALTALYNLAASYSDLGDYRNALKLWKRAYDQSSSAFGETNPETLRAMRHLADSYSDLGNHKTALDVLDKAYGIVCETQGKNSLEAASIMNSMALVFGELDNHQKEFSFAETAYAITRKELGEDDPNSLTLLNNLASAYRELGDYSTALKLQEDVYARRCKSLGEENPATLTTLNNLALTYGDMEDYQKSLELLEKTFALLCKILGKEHPDTRTCQRNLTALYNFLGNHRKALELTVNEGILSAMDFRHNIPFFERMERTSILAGKDPFFHRILRWLSQYILYWRIPFYPVLSVVYLLILHLLNGYTSFHNLLYCSVKCMLGQMIYHCVASLLMPIVYLLLEKAAKRRRSLLPTVGAIASAGIGMFFAWLVAGQSGFFPDLPHIIYLVLPFITSLAGWMVTKYFEWLNKRAIIAVI